MSNGQTAMKPILSFPPSLLTPAMVEYDNRYLLMGSATGKDVTELEHLEASLTRLYRTKVGTYPGLREYGCYLIDLVDKPVNSATLFDMVVAVHKATDRWGPRFSLVKAEATVDSPGTVSLLLEGILLLSGQRVTYRNMIVDFNPIA